MFTDAALQNIGGNRLVSAPNNVLSQVPNPKTSSNGDPLYASAVDTATHFGLNSAAQSDGSSSFGAYSNAVDMGSVAIGLYSISRRAGAIALGQQSAAVGVDSIVIGRRSRALTPFTTVIGFTAKATAGTAGTGHGVCIGYRSVLSGDSGIAIGPSSSGKADFGIAIGSQAQTLNGASPGTYPTAIGNFALSTGDSIAIGTSTIAGDNFNIALGSGAQSTFNNSIALGRAAITTANGQFMIGCATFPVNLSFTGKVKLYNGLNPTNGQLLIGNTAGVTFDAATLTGTNHQIIVTNGAGSITLSTPQDIDTVSSPTFVNLTLTGNLIHQGSNIGFFNHAITTQQVSAANLTNNVTAGGTTDQIDDFTNLAVYATDAAAIRNDIYQLARKLKQVNDALRAYGLLT